MDIINLGHDVLGETEYRKTLCTFLVFVSTCRRPASSRADVTDVTMWLMLAYRNWLKFALYSNAISGYKKIKEKGFYIKYV